MLYAQVQKAFIVLAFLQIVGLHAAITRAHDDGTVHSEIGLGDAVNQTLNAKLKRGAYFVLGIQSKIDASSDEIAFLKKNVYALEDRLADSQVEATKLTSQLENIERLVHKNEEKIRATILLIAQSENAIRVHENEIVESEAFLAGHARRLETMLETVYLQANVLFTQSGSEPDLLLLLSSEKGAGELLQEHEYGIFLQDASRKLARDILLESQNLNNEKELLKIKKEKLMELGTLLAAEKRMLLEASEAKKSLLEETQGKQELYEALLDLSRQDIVKVSVEIERLRENYDFFQKKLDEIKNNPATFGTSSPALTLELEEFKEEGLAGSAALAWPVSPSLGISAFFHDSAYEKALGVRHNAIDIRLLQGSRVRSAADGVVSKVVAKGLSYSYIIIAHADSVLTLYGHMSEILVSEGDVVRQGQVIGLSGGMPGTKGAGWLTTGPHLHFEVFKDFKHADPLDYLPLQFVPISTLPEKYLKRLELMQQTVEL